MKKWMLDCTGFIFAWSIALLGSSWVSGQVASHDITLQAPQTGNIPVITAITAYDVDEANDLTGNAHAQAPLFYPYNPYVPTNNMQSYDPWWDNLVSEEIQARLPVVMLSSCGSYTTNTADLTGPGTMNPRRLVSYLNAVHRAGADGTMQYGCFAEAAAQAIYTNYYNLPSNTLVDFSNQDSWNKIWWLRIVKPWFDTVPSNQWYKINGAVPLEFWGLNINTIYTNQQGNISQLFNYLAEQMQATYGVSPAIIMGSPSCDTTLADCTYYVGDNEWFGPPSTPYTMTSYKDYTWGGLVAGYINPGYYISGNGAYQNPNTVVVRTGFSSLGVSGANGDTLMDGLNAAVSDNAIFSIIEGYTDISESCGLYRSDNSSWSYPNQYLNIIASYTDLRTVTQRLLAAGCDGNNATTGNTGGAFLRSGSGGNLSVRALTGTAAISASSAQSSNPATNAFDGSISDKWYSTTVPSSSAPVWLQYDYGSGNTEVVTGYSVTSATDTLGRAPSSWQFQGSNNGTSWTNINSQSGQSFSAYNQTNTYTFSNNSNTAYRYYRLSITGNNGATDGVQLAEMDITIKYSNGGGWAVTNTTAGEYLQWSNINFSAGNYKFPICYSSTASHTASLSVDGNSLGTVTLPSSGNMNTFTTAYLGVSAIEAGTHTLRLTLIDGGPDVQWIFVKKYDPLMTFFSPITNCYLTAESGGNDAIVSNRTTAASWENFSVDDQDGAGTVSEGDTVNLQVCDGLYITAENGGASTLSVNRRVPQSWEGFKVIKVDGSSGDQLEAGDQVAFETSSHSNYITVEDDGTVDATGTSVGDAQTFTIGINAQ
jgi:hypothetical protein